MNFFSKNFLPFIVLGSVLLVGAVGFYVSGIFFGKIPAGEKAAVTVEPDKKSDREAPNVILKGAPPSIFPPYKGEAISELHPSAKAAASAGDAMVEKYTKELETRAILLKKEPGMYETWLGVSYIKKLFGNYLGTRDALEYAKIVNPASPVAYFNLGELYGYELHDAGKAEENYRAAVKLDPRALDYHVGLANFYEDVLQDSGKAEGAMLAAITAVPNTEVNLFTEVGAFYRDQKNYSAALIYFSKALEVATDPGVKKDIQSEIDYIRSKQ